MDKTTAKLIKKYENKMAYRREQIARMQAELAELERELAQFRPKPTPQESARQAAWAGLA